MNNVHLLEKKMSESGYKKKYIAAVVGLTYAGLQKKTNNQSAFTSTEIDAMCKVLKIKSLKEKEAIFFAKMVDEKSIEEGVNS